MLTLFVNNVDKQRRIGVYWTSTTRSESSDAFHRRIDYLARRRDRRDRRRAEQYRGSPPADRKFLRVRLSRHRVDRQFVPFRDRGQRGGVARTERAAGRRAAYCGPRARRPARTRTYSRPGEDPNGELR